MMHKTQHNCGGPIFGRLTIGCPRCDELRAGADPIRWRVADRSAQAQRTLIAAIRAHDCKRAGCGPVCTAFDW